MSSPFHSADPTPTRVPEETPGASNQALPETVGVPAPATPSNADNGLSAVSPFDLATQIQSHTAPKARSRAGRLGKYELVEEIAVGGMGVVYRARDTLLNRDVALKTIRSGLLAQPEEVERFYHEARAAAHLHHPNIVPIYDIALEEGQHYFTMALVRGGTLTHHLERLRQDPRAAVTLIEKVCRAVQHAHEQGVLHRDLKPANILIDEHGEPVVSDFGLAKFLHGDVNMTQAGQRLGTPSYMAPEQAVGDADRVSARTDVW